MEKSNLSVNASEEVIKVEEANIKKSSLPNLTNRKSSVCAGVTSLEGVDLIEDVFGLYIDENGVSHSIKRYTWRNRNKIQVQVINYGARITSIRMPDRKGSVDDIVLGFDDIAGYVHYKNKYFGATIGRMTNFVRNSTFQITNKQYWLTSNRGQHHYNGGRRGLDQVVWTTFMENSKVIMSHVSPNKSEGYPGDVLIRILFELSSRNEFSIKMEAQCTQPTILNLSNLTYFNLGGHHSGSTEVYKHALTMNCNCFTPEVDGFPTGLILNVAHSGFDFQIPKALGKVMGIVPKDGFNQNLCVNRGMSQEDCFVGRLLHPPSGRLLEVYSNQWGVQLLTANDFGYDSVMSTEQILEQPAPVVKKETKRKCEDAEPLLRLYEKVHKQIESSFSKDGENTFKEIYDLIGKLKDLGGSVTPHNTPEEPVDETVNLELQKKRSLPRYDLHFTDLQIEYLNNVLKVLCDSCDEDECEELKEIITKIICMAKAKENKKEEKAEEKEETPGETTKEEKLEKGEAQEKEGKPEIEIAEDARKKSTTSSFSKTKRRNTKQNIIPDFYTSTNKIIGKERAHYKMHGGIALQTQNYPLCANYKHFPNCVLKPGDTYVHTITYKFWVRAGNPTKWVKKNTSR